MKPPLALVSEVQLQVRKSKLWPTNMPANEALWARYNMPGELCNSSDTYILYAQQRQHGPLNSLHHPQLAVLKPPDTMTMGGTFKTGGKPL